MKKWLVCSLTLLLVLAGCSALENTASSLPEEAPSGAIVAEEETLTPSQPESEPAEESLPPSAGPASQDERAEKLVQALKSGEVTELETLAWSYDNEKKGSYDYLKELKLGEVSYSRLSGGDPNNGQAGVFELTLEVLEAGKTSLKQGKNQYILEIRGTGYDGPTMFYTIIPAEKYVPFELVSESKAASQVVQARSFGWLHNPFESADDLKSDLDVEYLLFMETDQYPEGMTQEQLDAAALKYYGAENGFERKISVFYNKEKQRYILLGRDGQNYNERVARIDRRDEGDVFVYIEMFTDGLQICLDKTMEYHLADNGDGTYRYVTARYVTPVE